MKTEGRNLYREIKINREAIDKENRTVLLSFSSEFPVERGWGKEILDHGSESVRLERINSRAPLLLAHDRRDQIGVVESARLNGRKGEALVRFSRSKLGEEIYQDVLDGIRTTVSFGYIVHRVILEEEAEGQETYRVMDWEPFEISMEPTPADYTVGVGRSLEDFRVVKENLKNHEVQKCVNISIKL